MRLITNCSELRTGNQPINSIIHNTPIENKEKILAYLKSGKDDGVMCSGIFDFVVNVPTGDTIHCYKDEEYKWNDSEIYHFENYNMELDPDFIKKIMGE